MPFIYETFAQRKISAEANAMTEYVLGLRGIVPNYGSQFLLQSVGTVLKVGTGMLVFTGRKGINTELLELDIVPETLGTKTKYIIVTLDGTQQPSSASASITVSDTSQGSITSKTEDLMANVQGIVKFDLGTFTNTTSGINSASLTITCPIIEQEIIDNIKDDIFGLQGDLSSVITKVDGLSGASRNIIEGTADMSGTLSPQFVTNDKYLGLTISRATAPAAGSVDTARFQAVIECNEREYICSFYAKADVSGAVCKNYFYLPNTTTYAESSTGQTSNSVDGSIDVTLSTTMKRYWIKWKQNPSNAKKSLIIGRPLAGSGATVEICGVALYEGNLTKDWSPAPEDSYGLEIGARNILRGSDNPILTTSSLEGTWANGKFYINQTGGTIQSVPVVNSPTPSVNKGIKLTRTTTGRIYLIQRDVYLEKGQYNASFWVSGTEGAVIKVLEVWTAASAENNSSGTTFTLKTGWNRLQVTRNVLNSENKSIFRLELFSEFIGQEVTILAPQLERSNIASDWRPAPDDIPYTRSQLISSATYAVGATIPFDLRQWDTIEVTVLANATVRLVQSRDTNVFRGDCIFFDGNKDQVTVAVEIQWDGTSSSWKLLNCSRLIHYSAPAGSWHSSKTPETIKNIYGISYR